VGNGTATQFARGQHLAMERGARIVVPHTAYYSVGRLNAMQLRANKGRA